MCEQKAESAETGAERSSAEKRRAEGCGCPCESRRCLPIAGAVLAAVAVPLVIRAIRRRRRSSTNGARRPLAAGCCA